MQVNLPCTSGISVSRQYVSGWVLIVGRWDSAKLVAALDHDCNLFLDSIPTDRWSTGSTDTGAKHITGGTCGTCGTAQVSHFEISSRSWLPSSWPPCTSQHDGGIAMNLANTNLTWATGWLSLDSERTDNTNWVAMMHSQLGPYTRSPDLYRCPADVSVGPVPGGQRLPRVRSISMNSYVGHRTRPYTSGYWQFKVLAEIIDPSPVRLFVFIDEREAGINDACFFVDMAGYRPPTLSPESYRLVDYPADRHHRAANLAFADGHTENWRWQVPRTTPPHNPGKPLPLNQASPGNPDVARIQAATSRRMIP